MCRDGLTQAELESQRAPTVFSLHRERVCVCVREREREYRLSEHSLSVEMGRHKQSWRVRAPTVFSLHRVCVCVCVCVCERESIV